MTRRCSHCSNNGHNSRTCPTRGNGAAGGGGGVGGLKLFGVKLTDGSIIKKSASMGNLSAHYHSSSSAAASPNPGSPLCDHHQVHVPDGYLSDDPAHASCSAHRRADRKKGVPWTEEEHRLFLLGLNKLGKGDWRGISRNFVTSRTPTQVASHAQKYFIRQTNSSRRKRRSSLFDMVTDSGTDQPQLPEEQFMLPPPLLLENDGEQLMALAEPIEPDNHNNSLPSLNLSLRPDFDSMDATSTTHEQSEETKETETPAAEELTPMIPSFFPAFIPVSFPVWTTSPAAVGGGEASHHQVLKPIPVLRRDPVNVDELVGLSQLSLGDGGGGGNGLSPLSLKLLGEPSRQSAFHASATANGTGTVVYKNNGSAV